jgi:hypothetical protein
MAPLIALSSNAWSGPWRNRQQLLSRLAKRGWPVVYSTGPLSLWDRNLPDWKDAPFLSRFDGGDGLINFIPGRFPCLWPKLPNWSRFVIRQHGRALKRQTGDRGDVIACVFRPEYWPFVKAINPRWVVYFAFDNFRREPDWSANDTMAEAALVERADLIVATTSAIAESLPRSGPSRAKVLANGADARKIADYANTPCPDLLQPMPKPRIGYCGSLNQKVDFELIAHIARQRPDWHWVLIGPSFKSGNLPGSDANEQAWQECERLPNVHFVGRLSFHQFAVCLHHMDVNVICHRMQGGWWQDGYPLKFHEYLATGRPVISVPLPCLMSFSEVADFASTPDAWIGALERAINDNGVGSPEARRHAALANDWELKTDIFEGWLGSFLAGR